MRYEQAQAESVSGVAVYGNEATQDVIWPRQEQHPYFWVKNGYIPLEATEKYVDSDEWRPLHPRRKADESREENDRCGDATGGLSEGPVSATTGAAIKAADPAAEGTAAVVRILGRLFRLLLRQLRGAVQIRFFI